MQAIDWVVTENTTTRNGVQSREEWRQGQRTYWRKKFSVTETELTLIIGNRPVFYGRNAIKMYEDGAVAPAYPMQSGFAEIVSVEAGEKDGLMRVVIVYADWQGERKETEVWMEGAS